jgi:hypothetical protein
MDGKAPAQARNYLAMDCDGAVEKDADQSRRLTKTGGDQSLALTEVLSAESTLRIDARFQVRVG